MRTESEVIRARPLSRIVWKALARLSENHGFEISGHIAFTTLLALFPFLIFLVAVAGFLGNTQMGQDFIGTLAIYAPRQVMETLQPAIQQVIENRSGGLLTI